jgi:hypothetical protein
MGRRPTDDTPSDPPAGEVLRLLGEVERSFEAVGYPNAAMRSLAALAMAEYRLADRTIDRRQWHQQLLSVARACRPEDLDEDGQRVVTGKASSPPPVVMDGW